MAQKYCISCGTKHDYTIDIPKFCSNCGKSFGGEAKAAKEEPKRITGRQRVGPVIQDEDEDADKEVPQISQIQVEIETDKTPKISFANAKNAQSFARDKATRPLTEKDLNNRLDELFENDRRNQKDAK